MQEEILSESEQAYLGKKKCTKCKNWLPLNQFNQKASDNWCRSCRSKYASEKYHADPDKRKKTLKANLKYMYGISPEEYFALLEAQGGVCAICKQVENGIDSRTKEQKRLVVDHDHSTGKVRGLLCSYCNTSLGWLEKKFDHLNSMTTYLEVHKRNEANDDTSFRWGNERFQE